ncbi:putative ribonuclease T(2) [Medicago truncatula]|uniref:Putative ribonuclease T(2) n=1 Tax=Medicago truncatula TaxID=3880 RepID=A0A396IQS7_MEDTR|nr:intracellular ribonuclease LX [Medicago truncatula]RHN66275.1 putative ribonuclease T(2) [Medicago truncatula]
MSLNMIPIIIIFVGLLLASSSCSYSTPNNTSYYKTLTPTSPSLSHDSPSPYYSPLLNKGKKKPPPTPPLPPPQPIVTPFEYLKIVQTWPTSFCKFKKCIIPPPTTWFTIHGVWPSNISDPQPRLCTKEKIDWSTFSSLVSMTDLRKYWPRLDTAVRNDDLFFWSEQWDNHGTCSSMHPPDFFNLAFKIYHKKELKTILQNEGIIPGGIKPETSQKIFDTIETGIGGFKPQIECLRVQNKDYLYQIKLCLDKTGDKYKDCPGPLIKCPMDVYFP